MMGSLIRRRRRPQGESFHSIRMWAKNSSGGKSKHGSLIPKTLCSQVGARMEELHIPLRRFSRITFDPRLAAPELKKTLVGTHLDIPLRRSSISSEPREQLRKV